MKEEKCSINLMKLNEEYLELYSSEMVAKARRKQAMTFFQQMKLVLDFIKFRRYKEVFFAIKRRVFHSSEKEQEKEQNNFEVQELEIDDNLKKKVVVYTCVIGTYDDIKEPLYKNPYCDFMIITDQIIDPDSVWMKKDILANENLKNMNGFEINRWVKLHPHILFPEYEYSVYVDGSILIVADILPLVCLMKNKLLGTHLLASGVDCVYESAKAVIAAQKAPEELVRVQMDRYRKEGYPKHNGMFENGILIRKHNEAVCIDLMEAWWKEMKEHTMRDQLSLNYIIWKSKFPVEQIQILGKSIYRNPRFRVSGHNKIE